MKSNRKSQEGKADHPDIDAQFNFINGQTKEFQKARFTSIISGYKEKG